MRAKILFLSVLFAAKSQGAELPTISPQLNSDPQPAVEPRVDDVPNATPETPTTDDETGFAAQFIFAPLDLLVPFKFGIAALYRPTPERGYEVEYLYGAVGLGLPYVGDLGSLTEHRMGFNFRSFLGAGGFNLFYGASWSRVSMHLGSELLATVSNDEIPSVDVVAVDTIGANLGVGNRWVAGENLVIGIDWVGIHQPFVTTRNFAPFIDKTVSEEYRDEVKVALKIARYTPRLLLLRAHLGWKF